MSSQFLELLTRSVITSGYCRHEYSTPLAHADANSIYDCMFHERPQVRYIVIRYLLTARYRNNIVLVGGGRMQADAGRITNALNVKYLMSFCAAASESVNITAGCDWRLWRMVWRRRFVPANQDHPRPAGIYRRQRRRERLVLKRDRRAV